MKKIAKVSSLVLFTAFAFIAVSVGVSGNSTPNIEGANAGSGASTATRKLYLNNCARCHGADGKSMTTLGQELDTPDITTSSVKGMSAAKMSRIIAKGDGSMPAFGKKLKPAQIASIVRYVKTL